MTLARKDCASRQPAAKQHQRRRLRILCDRRRCWALNHGARSGLDRVCQSGLWLHNQPRCELVLVYHAELRTFGKRSHAKSQVLSVVAFEMPGVEIVRRIVSENS